MGALISVAPTGFPCLNDIRICLMNLHKKKKICAELEEKHVWRATAEAGDNWRVMCKHIYNLKKQGPSNVDLNQYPKVKHMVEEIILPSRPSSTDLQ